MAQALAVAMTEEAQRKRKAALGPSERPSALRRLLASGRIAEPAERPVLLREFIADELKAIGTFGVSEIREICEALERGDRAEALAKLVGAGMAAHHAYELFEKLEAVHLLNAVGRVAGHAAHAAGAMAIGLGAVELALMQAQVGCAIIRQAHAEGERDAAIYKYAQVWSELVVERLYDGGVVRPDTELLPHLEEARRRGLHDAIATLQIMEAQPGLADQLRQELGTRGNAKRTLMHALFERAGVRGVLNHMETR
jgi:hypothetical protein